MGFNDFLRRGLVEYVDVNEENNSLIALYEVLFVAVSSAHCCCWIIIAFVTPIWGFAGSWCSGCSGCPSTIRHSGMSVRPHYCS